VPADGYLRRVLADGALPFRYRGSVRALLGEPDGPGLLRATPPVPQPRFSYPRSAWMGEIELPDGILTMTTGPLDWPGGHDRPRGHRDRGAAAGVIGCGTPDEIPEPATDHPPALRRPALTADRGPQPGAAARPRAVMELGPAEAPGPAPATPTGSAHSAQPLITEPAPHMTAEPAQAPVARSDHPQEPQAGPGTDAGPGPVGPPAAAPQRGPKPTASAGGSRELQIPGRTVRSSVMTGSEEAGARPDPSGLTSTVSKRQSAGPLRRSGAEPAELTGREPATTASSGDRSAPDPGLTVRRIPPHHPGATARQHDGGTVIPHGQATPLRVQGPAGPGRQADIVPVGRPDTTPPLRPAPDAGSRSRTEQPSATPPATAPTSAPQLIVMLPPRTPTAPPAFWERRHLGRLWSRPLR
jgi:hypothetical protein